MVKTKTPKLKIVKSKTVKPIRLDLGCGQNKQEGFIGVDLYAPDADLKVDLFAPHSWPWKDSTVDEIVCSHFIEHIPQHTRWPFFDKVWSMMKVDAVMKILVPSWKSERAYGDMTHCWPPVTGMFFWYLNRQWREANKLTYGPYALKCNFENQCGPTGLNPTFADRLPEAQVWACTHYMEAYPDMWVTLTKKL